MGERVTIQDIADALGVSRNTVSKAINNTGSLADATREKILQKAIEMGYKQFSYSNNIADLNKMELQFTNSTKNKEIALFTTIFLTNSHFSSTMLDKFQTEIAAFGYSLTMHRILKDEIDNLLPPASFDKERTAGIICFEMFDNNYSNMICNLGIPTLFVDSPVFEIDAPLKADKLYMDNSSGIFKFIKEMKSRNKTTIGFIGEHMHCQSFFERYIAFRNAMFLFNLPIQEEFCIVGNKEVTDKLTPTNYQDYVFEHLSHLKKLPDVFICANDFIALDVLQVFKRMGISVPKDVYLCGFDDSQESKLISPSLTTIHIHSQIMGYSAVQLLLSRIKEPHLNYRTMHTETSLIYRESTED